MTSKLQINDVTLDVPDHPGLLYVRELAAQRWKKLLQWEEELRSLGHVVPYESCQNHHLIQEIIDRVRRRGGLFKEQDMLNDGWKLMSDDTIRTTILNMFLLIDDIPGTANHPGQICARKLVAEKYNLYVKLPQQSRSRDELSRADIVSEVTALLKANRRNFKKFGKDCAWIVLSESEAKRKVQTLFNTHPRTLHTRTLAATEQGSFPPLTENCSILSAAVSVDLQGESTSEGRMTAGAVIQSHHESLVKAPPNLGSASSSDRGRQNAHSSDSFTKRIKMIDSVSSSKWSPSTFLEDPSSFWMQYSSCSSTTPRHDKRHFAKQGAAHAIENDISSICFSSESDCANRPTEGAILHDALIISVKSSSRFHPLSIQEDGDSSSPLSASSICNDMASNSEDPSVVLSYLDQLKVLVSTLRCPFEHELGSCVSEVLRAMEKYVEKHSIQSLGGKILRELILNHCPSIVLQEIEEKNGIKVVVSAMREHPKDVAIQETGCQIIGALAFYDRERKEKVAQAGGIKVLVQCLQKHHKTTTVVGGCCAALGFLAFNNRENQDKIASARGIQAVLKAMRFHRDNACIQERCCYAFSRFASNNKQNQKILIEGGCLYAVLEAAQKHPREDVLRRCCDILIMVAMNNSHVQERIGEAQWIKILIERIIDPRSQDEEVSGALEALVILASSSVANQNRMLSEGGPGHVIHQMRRRLKDPDVQRWGCEVFTAVSRSLSSLSEIRDETIDTILSAMREHTMDAEIQNVGCNALAGLATTLGNRAVIEQKGGSQALLTAMMTHPKDSDISAMMSLFVTLSLDRNDADSAVSGCHPLGVMV